MRPSSSGAAAPPPRRPARILNVPGLLSVGAGLTGSPGTIKFPANGRVTRVYLGIAAPAPGATPFSLECEIKMGDGTPLFIEGDNSSSRANVGLVMGARLLGGDIDSMVGPGIPIYQPVKGLTSWAFTFKNIGSVLALLPCACLLFEADA